MSNYATLAAIDCSSKVEKKNGLTYLSWAWAVDQLFRADPAANWRYNPPTMWGDTVMVSCTVSAFGAERTMQLPVMDHRNKAIANPDAFQVNTAMQRCLVKAIALHGLGLYIYAGEDLPPNEKGETAGEIEANKKTEKKITPTAGVLESMGDEQQYFIRETAQYIQDRHNEQANESAYYHFYENRLTQEEMVAVWSLLDSKCRAHLKKMKAEKSTEETKNG